VPRPERIVQPPTFRPRRCRYPGTRKHGQRRTAVGTIVITTNVTLDGVVEDPDGQEGTAQGGWFRRYGGADLGEWETVMTEEALGAAALLLGRRSDEWFAKRWLSRDGVWADRLNTMPKYVVSSTLEAGHWGDATVVSGDLVAELTAVKEAV